MKTMLDQHKDTAYALLRIVSGFLFFCHGAQKIFGVMLREGQEPRELDLLIGTAGVIEVVGGIMLILGLMTGIVAFICSGQMAVAYFMRHQFATNDAGMMRGWFPIENGGELAVLYCFLFLFIAMTGAGKWSLDNR